MKISVTSGADPAAELTQELREAATAVRQDKGNRAWLASLLNRVGGLADRAVDVALTAAIGSAMKAVFG
jgi:hypothetical protein